MALGPAPGNWLLLGLLWLLAALPVHGRGDAFQAEEMQENDLDETTSPSDDILDINRELILLEAPESSVLVEGDIVKVSPFRMFPSADLRWPKKRGIVQIPYIISYKYDKSSVKKIKEAFQDLEKFTCIKFVPYSYQRDFILIAPLSGCFSSVGRTGGVQVVSLAAACLRKGKGVALHELMHVLGFWHEHSRADRDKYISISWNEILTGFETNFMKTWTPNMLVDYDYSSIMHYGRNAFSMTGLPTIVPLSRSCTVIGQSWNLSSSDIARVNKLYRCSQVAVQPEAETEGAIEGTTVEFAPSESEPCSPKSKAGVSTTWRPSPIAAETSHSARETLQQLGTTVLSSRAVEEGSSARRTAAPEAEEHDWHVVSRETPSKAEVDGKGLMVAEGMLHRTQPTEVAAESTALKASELQTEQKVGSSTNQPPHYKEDYTPSGQNATETAQAATEVALAASPLLTSPAPLTTVVAKGTERRPSKSVLHQLLSGTRPMHGEQTEPSASVEVGSNELEDDDGSPSPAEGHPFSVMENATKEEEDLFHTTVSRTGDKVGDSAHTHLTRVWAKAISSPYMRHSPKDPGNPVVATNIGGPFSPTGSEAGSQTDITIDHYSRMVDTGMERLPENEMPYTQSSSRRASAASESVLWATSGEAPALESSDGDLYQSRPTAGARSPWGNIMGHLAASRLNKVMESHPTDHSKEGEQSSLPPAHLAREGELFTLLSQGSALPTEQVTLEKWASVHVALPTQAPTLRELASLAPETKWVTHPTKGSSLPGVSWSQSPRPTELRHMASWGQPSSTKGYGSSTLVSRQAPSVGGELLHPALEAVSLATLERPSLGQKASLGLGQEEEPGGQAHLGTELPEEAKTDGRASLWRVLSTVSSGTQMLPKLGCRIAENQWQQSSSLSEGTSATGASPSGLQTKDLTGLRTALSALSWRGGMTGSPYVAQTAEGSPGLQLKPVVIKGMSPGAETKGHGSLLKEMFLPVTERSLSSGWVSLSGSLREDNRTDHYTEPLEDASSAARSELAKLLKGTPGSAVASKERTAEMTHVGSTALSLRGPTSQGVQESPNSLPVGGTESPTNSWSPSVQFLDQTSGRDHSQPEKGRRFAEGRLAEPADIAEEMAQEGMNWATTHAVNATLERRGLASPLLGVGSTALKSGAVTRGTDLPRTAGSPESPRLALDSEGLAASHPPGAVLPPAVLPVDGAAASSQAYIASAIPLEAWENQTTAATAATAALSGVSSKSWEPSVGPTAVGTQPLTEIRRLASPGAAILGHTATKPAVVGSLPLQTEMAHLEETTWSTAETKGVAKVMKFLFEEGKTPTMKSRLQVSRDTAVYTHLGSKRSAVNSTEIPETASMDVHPFLPRNTKEWDKPTAAPGKEGATYDSVSPTSKLPLETIGSLGPGNGRTSEMALPVFGAVNSSSGEKSLPSENRNPVPVEPSEGAAASTVGISPVHPQTLGSAEIGTSTAFYQLHATQGLHSYSELLLSKLTPEGMGDRKHLFAPVEGSKQAFEAQTVVRLDEEMTSLSKEVELQQNGKQSIDRHNIRRISKRSLPEMVPSPSPAYVLPKERHRDCEPLRWQTRHLKSRKLEEADSEKATPTFLRKCGLAGTHQLPVESTSGCVNQIAGLPRCVSHTDGAFAVKNKARRMEPTRGSNAESAAPRRWLSPVKMAGNSPLGPQNTVKPAQPWTFCCFEQAFCGWEQSKEEAVHWVLEKEPRQPPKLVGPGIPSRMSCRTLDGGHISLKPAATKVPSQKAVLISPVLHGTGCLKFFYSPTGSVMGKMSIYIKLLNSSEWHQVWPIKGDREMGWYPVAMPLAKTCKLQCKGSQHEESGQK